MRTLLDTNILVHAYNSESPVHRAAREVLRDALTGNLEAVITPQVLYEFYAVSTDPRRVSSPLEPQVAAAICRDLALSPEMEKIHTSEASTEEALSLAEAHGLRGPDVFDCVLAATAKQGGVRRIYTENVADFARFGFLEAVNPLG